MEGANQPVIRKLPDSKAFTIIVTTLVFFGLVMVLSASSVKGMDTVGSSYYFAGKQALFAVGGFILMLFLSRLNHRNLRSLAIPAVAIALVLLVLVLIPGIGVVVKGARRWIDLGPIGFQPSEFAKLAVILFSATYLASKAGALREFRDILPPVIVAAVLGTLVLKQPDMGTTSLIMFAAMVTVFIAGARLRHLASLGAAMGAAAWIAISTEPYRAARLTAFLDPWKDPQGIGYQVVQSMIAFGSGGLFGVGIGMSRQKFSYLPENYTDFVLAVIGEEFGLVGTIAVLGLFVAFGYFGFRIAFKAPDTYGKLLAGGLTAAIVVQAAINMAAVTSLMPVTGVPLPFISAGGSALLLNMGIVGIILSVSRAQKIGVVRERRPQPQRAANR